jgi:excisionase family DNA binding protein
LLTHRCGCRPDDRERPSGCPLGVRANAGERALLQSVTARDHSFIEDLGAWPAQHRQACLTPEEAAHLLGVGRTTLYGLLGRGELSSFTIGRARRIPVTSLERFIGERLARGL